MTHHQVQHLLRVAVDLLGDLLACPLIVEQHTVDAHRVVFKVIADGKAALLVGLGLAGSQDGDSRGAGGLAREGDRLPAEGDGRGGLTAVWVGGNDGGGELEKRVKWGKGWEDGGCGGGGEEGDEEESGDGGWDEHGRCDGAEMMVAVGDQLREAKTHMLLSSQMAGRGEVTCAACLVTEATGGRGRALGGAEMAERQEPSIFLLSMHRFPLGPMMCAQTHEIESRVRGDLQSSCVDIVRGSLHSGRSYSMDRGFLT